MKIIKTKIELQNALKKHLKQSIGFVPTMGALHQGHITLVNRSVSENDISIVSIFVNPIQFNDKTDLNNYPRNLEEDTELLEKTHCNFIFAPSVEEMYPEKITETYNFGTLETVMEGAHRPGHFNGVAIVVKRLFDITNPTRAYFGMKDFQQLAIIKELVRQKQLPLEIIACPTIREKDGLAMSSRNKLLNSEQRHSATLISQTLFKIKENFNTFNSISEIKAFVTNEINSSPLLQLEYFEISDQDTLVATDTIQCDNLVACIAVNAGKVRLIDNIII